jgi:hypothetical protein
LTKGRFKGKELAIDVAWLDGIKIDQPELADSGSGQPLHGIASDGAKSDNGYSRFLERSKTINAK